MPAYAHAQPRSAHVCASVGFGGQSEKLLDNCRKTGDALLAVLQEAAATYPSLLKNPRGQGTICAVDGVDTATRDTIVDKMRHKGVLMGE